MDFNELKVRILGLFDPSQEYHSLQIRDLLSTRRGVRLSDRAVKMALLRYWRQGLLMRVRRGRRFYYKLTERGLARKDWLLKTM